MTIRQRRIGASVFGVLIVGWLACYFLNLYRLGYGGLDSWACFSPGVAAARPLGIKAPLLGGYLGADHTWGLHWPGAPLLYSCLFALVPWSTTTYILLFMALTAGIAVVTFRLVQPYAGDSLVAAAAAMMVLADRLLFGLGQMCRPEVGSTLVLALSVWLLAGLKSDRNQDGRVAALGGCFFLCPLLHPVLLPLGGLLGTYALWRAWLGKRTGRGIFLVGCYVAGTAAFAGWFYFQPDAWHQLLVNGKGNAHPFAWGGTFLAYIHETAPLYTSGLLYVFAFLGCAVWLRLPREFIGPGADETDGRVIVFILLGGTVVAQIFPNPVYQTIMLPEAVVCAVLAARWLARRWLSRENVTGMLVSGVMVFTALHGVFWTVRTLRYFQNGQPNLRAEIHALVLSLPKAHTVLISDILWEEGLRQPDKFLLCTLPFPCDAQTRIVYEHSVLGKTVPGDLILMDLHDLVSLATPLPPEQWEVIHHYLHRLPGRNFWGYELVLYRKRAIPNDKRVDPGGTL